MRISRVNSTSAAINNPNDTANIIATRRAWPTPLERGDERANQKPRGDQRAQNGEINGATEENHPPRKRSGDRSRGINGGGVGRAQRPALVGDPLQPRYENRQKSGHRAEHERWRRRVGMADAQMIDIGNKGQFRRLPHH